ncbi:MAG: PKD domain-containing protein [Flavobacteriales bacterium]|nr:PKD domain-containing protein [Flavobacteriales bacterium]
MKKLLYIASLVATAFFSACSPSIEVRDLGTELPKMDITIDDADPNQPILTVSDPSVFNATWDFGGGVLLQGKTVKGFFPLEGYYKYTLTAMNGLGASEGIDSVYVSKSNPDMVYDIEEYSWLVGEKGEGGKVWIWDQEEVGGNVSYMTAGYDWDEFWWNPYAGDDGASLADLTNEIKFDLEGAFNFTRYSSKDVEAEKGNFVLNINEMSLSISGAHIPNWNEPNLDDAIKSTGQYTIQVINKYELLLWQNDEVNGYGWAWKFKARDLDKYSDPIYKLAGKDTESGKTWIFNQDAPGENVCYMTANYDWEEFWWNPYDGDAGTDLPDYNNDIKFELDYTYTRMDVDGNEIEKGKYTFDSEAMVITLMDAHLPNYNDSNLDPDVIATNTYQVKILDNDNLLMWQDQSTINPDDFDYAWAWSFKVKN